MKDVKLIWINTISFLLMICTNAIANLLPLGGKTTGEISSNYPNLFTPAPYTFSIWGVIYVLMAVFVVAQFLGKSDVQPDTTMQHIIGIWFAISCAMNICWLLCWHSNRIGLSVIFMLGLLFSMIVIVLNFQVSEPDTFLGRLSLYGFQIYLGWICAATIANISVYLVKIGWSRFHLPEQFWTVLAVLAGMLIGTLMVLISRNYLGVLAIMWAYLGILVRHTSTDGYGSAYPIVILSLVLSLLIMGSAIYITLPTRDENCLDPRDYR